MNCSLKNAISWDGFIINRRYRLMCLLATVQHLSYATLFLLLWRCRWQIPFETSVYKPTRRHIPEDGILPTHLRGNIKSYELIVAETSVSRCAWNLLWRSLFLYGEVLTPAVQGKSARSMLAMCMSSFRVRADAQLLMSISLPPPPWVHPQ
jgi:hypothetical protein